MQDLSHQQTDETPPDGPMLFGRVLDGKGGCRVVDWAEAKTWSSAAPGEVLWVHLCRNRPEVSEWLEHQLCILEPTVEVLVSDTTRPRAFIEGHTLVGVLRGINFNPGAEPEDMIAMQFWSDGERLVTLRRRRLHSPRDVLAAIDQGRGARDAGRLMTDLIEALINRMSRSIIDMNDEIDDLEHADPEMEAKDILTAISKIRRNCLGLKRHMAPQHEALEIIGKTAPGWFDEGDRREIIESIDRLRRYLDDLDISKESALVLQDDIRSRVGARSQRTNYLLTLIAAIFLPLGFVTGLLGINVGGVPGLNDGHAFWIVLGLCGAIFIMQMVLFWRWKWL